MKSNEILALNSDQIITLVSSKKLELSKLKINHRVAQIENPISIRNLRKDISRLLTQLTKLQS